MPNINNPVGAGSKPALICHGSFHFHPQRFRSGTGRSRTGIHRFPFGIRGGGANDHSPLRVSPKGISPALEGGMSLIKEGACPHL